MKICSFFPNTKNVDLIKGVGLNIYLLQKEYDYESMVICFNKDNYDYLDTELKGLDIDFISNKYPSKLLNCICYLIRNSKNIDILRVFHYSIPTFIYMFIYKLFNRKGIIYFTIDTDYNTALRLNGLKKGIRYKFETLMSIFLFKYLIDFASIETKKAHKVFIESHDIYKEKLIYIPCFINPNPKIMKNKKNQILSVGRIGSHQKASEIVLNSYKKIFDEMGDEKWILKMVGPISNEFNEYLDDFFSKYPYLKKYIIFTGNVDNRDELYKIYSESKIFCLPSRYGSFEIVFAEALFYDNYLIVTDVGVGSYLIKISKFGKLVKMDDVDDISNELIKTIKNYNELYHEKSIDLRKLIKNEFFYRKYLDLIDSMIKKSKNY